MSRVDFFIHQNFFGIFIPLELPVHAGYYLFFFFACFHEESATSRVPIKNKTGFRFRFDRAWNFNVEPDVSRVLFDIQTT